MSIVERARVWFREQSTRGRESRTEEDVPIDDATAASRPVGGEERPDSTDRNSSTGTTPNETFVGRGSGGDDTDVGISGAEKRLEES